jgi:hypothetical protein
MRTRIGLILSVLIFGCTSSSNDAIDSKNEVGTDAQSGIITHELNAKRLNATAFNNEMFSIQQNVSNQVGILFRSDSITIDRNLTNALFEIEVNIAKVKEIIGPDNAKEFKKSILDLLNFYKNDLEMHFSKMIPMVKTSNPTLDQLDKLEQYDQMFAFEEENRLNQIRLKQNEFAKANNINLKDK